MWRCCLRANDKQNTNKRRHNITTSSTPTAWTHHHHLVPHRVHIRPKQIYATNTHVYRYRFNYLLSAIRDKRQRGCIHRLYARVCVVFYSIERSYVWSVCAPNANKRIQDHDDDARDATFSLHDLMMCLVRALWARCDNNNTFCWAHAVYTVRERCWRARA